MFLFAVTNSQNKQLKGRSLEWLTISVYTVHHEGKGRMADRFVVARYLSGVPNILE